VEDNLRARGHECRALNIGKSRKIPSDEYVTCRSLFDYICKTFWHAFRGYTMHMHANGDGAVGLGLALISCFMGFICFRRVVVSFHAGVEQQNFPREKSGKMLFFYYLLFKLPKKVLCDNEAVREKIIEYGISPDKVQAIQTFGSDYVKGENVPLPEHVEEFIQNREPVLYTYFFLREGFHLETFVEGIRRLADRYPNFGIVNAGAVEDNEPPMKEKILKMIDDLKVSDQICFADDLSHDQFLTLTRRSKLYLRTPTSDGEAASVLEALTMGVPVVASENGTRPESVVTYKHDDPDDLTAEVVDVLENYEQHCDMVIKPAVHDTIGEEADALLRVNLGRRAAEVLDLGGATSDSGDRSPKDVASEEASDDAATASAASTKSG